VRTRLLCQDLPPPPQDVDTNLEPPPPNTTNRERYRAHSAAKQCSGCHQMMDPIGFTFEHYDTFGRYQARDQNQPIDQTGMLYFMPEGDVPLSGPKDLIDYLAESEAVRECVVRYWSYYAYGRDTWEDKECTAQSILDESKAEGGSLKSTFLALLHTPHFTRRVKDL